MTNDKKDSTTTTTHASIRDITEHKLAEEKSQKILEATPDAMIIIDEEGKITFVNTQTEKVFGYTKNELTGQKVEILIPEPYRSRHPEHRRNFFNAPHTRPMGTGMELYGQRKNKEIFPVEISLSPLDTKEGMVALAAIRDITERKQAEKEIAELNQRLLTSARQAGMAEIANSILHNIGNILNSINVSIELIQSNSRKSNLDGRFKLIINLINEDSLNEYLKQNEKGKLLFSYVQTISEISANNYKKMTDEIQSLSDHVDLALDIISKQQSISGPSVFLEKTSIEEILESAIKMSNLVNNDIIIKRYFDNIPLLYTDKNKLLQILINLILNAKDAFSASNQSHKNLTLYIKMMQDNCINIIVQDNGVGISPDNLGHIFSFGFSTKKEGHGFGLHNSWLLAKELGGSLDAKSDGIGKGSIFTLALPMNKKESKGK